MAQWAPRRPRTSSSYVAAIGSFGQQTEWQAALHLLREFHQRCETCDVFVYSSTIAACANWRVAVSLLGELQIQQLEGNVVAYGATIGACEKNSQWRWAVHLLSTLQEQMILTNPRLAMQPWGLVNGE
eukprot:Skav222146  [mRNA]  locus=scaffold4223:46089:47516:+ [translate_table: standard]